MWGRRKNLEFKKKSQIQSLRWILCKVNRKIALEPIFKNLLNLELLEKYLKIDQELCVAIASIKSRVKSHVDKS